MGRITAFCVLYAAVLDVRTNNTVIIIISEDSKMESIICRQVVEDGAIRSF